MKNKNVFLLLLLNAALSATSQAVECVPIQTLDSREYMWERLKAIEQPGSYCLNSDVDVLGSTGPGMSHGTTNGTLLQIKTSNTSINLQGYSMHAIASGIKVVGTDLVRNRSALHSIFINNGLMTSSTDSGILLGLSNEPRGSLISDFGALSKNLSEREINYSYKYFLSKLPENSLSYKRTAHQLFNLHITANSLGAKRPNMVGVAIMGGGNVIRNSVIEITQGQAALYLFGPDQIIENNVIWIHSNTNLEAKAAIRLHQGDNSVIRNNDIIVEDCTFDKNCSAIALFDSSGVKIEGNRIYGVKQVSSHFGASQSNVEENNEFPLSYPALKR